MWRPQSASDTLTQELTALFLRQDSLTEPEVQDSARLAG